MDHHVHEDAAGHRRVLRRRGLRIAGADAHVLDLADLARSHSVPHGPIVVVVAAVEAYLIDELLGGGGQGGLHLFDPRDALIDGLLAEDVLPGGDGLQGKLCVEVGGGADEHCVDPLIL